MTKCAEQKEEVAAMKRPLCWIGLGCFAAAAAFCSFYPAKEWVFPAIALFGLSGLFCLLSARTRPAAIFSFSAAICIHGIIGSLLSST